MAPFSFSFCFLLRTLLLTLLLASLTTSTLQNPFLLPTFVCLPPSTANQPTAIDCTAAVLTLPSTQVGFDYHTNGQGRIVYDTTLTSIGPPNSPYHLPRSPQVGSCRLNVRLADGVQFARIVWVDVQQSAVALINRCVGDGRILPPRPGPGAGGSTTLGAVLISVEYAGQVSTTASPEPAEVIAAEARREANFRVGAYYPPGHVSAGREKTA